MGKDLKGILCDKMFIDVLDMYGEVRRVKYSPPSTSSDILKQPRLIKIEWVTEEICETICKCIRCSWSISPYLVTLFQRSPMCGGYIDCKRMCKEVRVQRVTIEEWAYGSSLRR